MANTAQIFPWGLHPLDEWIKTELTNRAQELDMNPTTIGHGIYSGPRTAWTRVFSNGISSLAPTLEGFVMGGTQGFDNSYGFNPNGQVTLGVDAWGNPHTLQSTEVPVDDDYDVTQQASFGDFPNRPPPSVVSVESEFSGGSNSSFGALCRKTKITWKCWSLSQLEYLTPYFLTPRISVLTEWGWNNYDSTSLVDLTDLDYLYGIFQGLPQYTTDWVQQSNGNYDLAMGFITDYGYTMNEVGGYDCFTTITNANYLIEGQSYQDANTTGNNPQNVSGSVQLKDFTEFIFEDMTNLEIKTSKSKSTTVTQVPATGQIGSTNVSGPISTGDTSNALNLSTVGKIFKADGGATAKNSANTDGKTWLRMDLVTDIINKFFAMKFVDQQGNYTGTSAATLDITNVVICGNPALKSTDVDILIPNQYAPRFVTSESGPGSAAPTLDNAQITGSANTGPNSPINPYYSLFPNIKNIITDNGFDGSYDDLYLLINGKQNGRSFPVYSDYIGDNNVGQIGAGYWGYLQDIYVSSDLLKDLVQKNDTVLKLVEELIQHISEAMCNIAQLKLIPDSGGNERYSICDMNFSGVNTAAQAAKLQRISLGSVNSAYIRTADFGVKLSAEMSNQMVMQSASGKGSANLPGGAGTTATDPKKMVVSKFSAGDRMFDRGVIPQTTTSNNDPTSPKEKLKRFFTNSGQSNFYTYTAKDGTVYILCETNSSWLKTILLDMNNAKAVYTNNALMPGTQINLEFLGIAGIRFLAQFTLDHVPSSYNYKRAVWQVSDVKQKIENKMWTTSVTAQARPLTALS